MVAVSHGNAPRWPAHCGSVNDATHQHRTRLILCLGIVYLVWGSSYLASRIGVRDLPPFLFGGVRFTIAGALLYAFARFTGRARGKLDASEWRHLFWVAFGTVCVSNACNVWGMQWVASNQAALLNTSSAFWIALLGIFGRRAYPLTLRTGLGLVIGFIGTALLLQPQGAAVSPHGRLVPELVMLIGCFGWAASTIYLRNAGSQLDLLSFTGLQMLLGGVLLLALGIAAGEPQRWQWSAPAIGALLYLMIFSSGIAYSAYAWLTQHATPAQVGSYGFVNPALATLLGWAVLDEKLGVAQLGGMVVVLLALWLINLARPPKNLRDRISPD